MPQPARQTRRRTILAGVLLVVLGVAGPARAGQLLLNVSLNWHGRYGQTCLTGGSYHRLAAGYAGGWFGYATRVTIVAANGYAYYHGPLLVHGAYRIEPRIRLGVVRTGRVGRSAGRRIVYRGPREISKRSDDAPLPPALPAPRQSARRRKLERLTTSVAEAIADEGPAVSPPAASSAKPQESSTDHGRHTPFSEPINYFGEGRTIDDLYD
jgi:hypothetical protein